MQYDSSGNGPVMHLRSTSPLAALTRELARPSHLVYLLLFLTGIVVSARTLFAALPTEADPAHGVLRTLAVISLFLFLSTNSLHQYLIYGELLDAEQPDSELARDLSPAWIGRRLELLMRLIVLVCLMAIAGKVEFPGVGAGVSGDRQDLAIANCCLFFSFLAWSACATRVIAAPGGARRTRARLAAGIPADALAFLLWLCVFFVPWRPASYSVILIAALYAGYIVYWRIYRERQWFRLAVVVGTLLILVCEHLQVFRPDA